MNVASPVPLVRVVLRLMSAAANPVTLLENVIGRSKVVTCVLVGSVKSTFGTVVSKLIASDVALLAGPVRVPSVTESAATSKVIVPLAAVGDVTVAVQEVPEPFNVNVALPVPLVRVVVIVISAAANPVTLLLKVIGTSNVFVTCVPVGSVKSTVATVVSKLIASDVALLAGPVTLLLSVTAFAATSNVIVPFAAVGDVTVAV